MTGQPSILLLSLLASFGLADYGVGQAALASQSLPDDPCDLLTADELTAISKVQVTAVRRLPSIQQLVTAQHEGRDPDPGEICSFETESPFGAIMIVVPPRSDRSAKHYWVARSEYFETFPGSAQHVERVGLDAWLAGGASLRVLVGENEYLMLSTQMYQRESPELLVKIARALLRTP